MLLLMKSVQSTFARGEAIFARRHPVAALEQITKMRRVAKAEPVRDLGDRFDRSAPASEGFFGATQFLTADPFRKSKAGFSEQAMELAR